MKEDLIFHLVREEDWKQYRNGSVYKPESVEKAGYVHCSSGHQVRETANRLFEGEENILLLVVNTSLIERDIKYEKKEESGEEYPHIYGSLNTGAVIERIKLAPEPDGSFDISFKVDQ